MVEGELVMIDDAGGHGYQWSIATSRAVIWFCAHYRTV